VFVASGSSRGAGRRRPARRGVDPRRVTLVFGVLLVLGAVGAGVFFVQQRRASNDRRRAAIREYIAAWQKRDIPGLYALTSVASRPSLPGFQRLWKESDDAAGVQSVQVGSPSALSNNRSTVTVTVKTADFGTLRGDIELVTDDVNDKGRIVWSPRLRLPGLTGDEVVKRVEGTPPPRGQIFAADGSDLAGTASGAGIAGTPPADGQPATGLQRIYDDRLGGHPKESLKFGKRTIRRVQAVAGRDIHTTLSPGLTQVAENALGSKLGGVAVIRPKDGAILAVAGLAVSAPQPPGSTFKIITLSGALQHGIATPSSSYPVQTAAVLSGVELRNAGGESCGGALPTAFADSCNSVFAPLGAKLGAKKLVKTAEAFGFNTTPRVPAAKESSIFLKDLTDDLATGAAAIGQNKDQATPLQMAAVGGVIANDGVYVAPRIVKEDPVKKHRAVSKTVAGEVTSMMIGVVQGGTGTAGAVPGVTVAGKTGTAELVENSTNPQDADAWFVAFAPADDPQIAVAVMLVGAGFGGTSAAPISSQVMSAALG
jgi:hypothetical protein